MTIPFNASPRELADRILCYYTNETPQVQLARLVNAPDCCFERVVFPRERLLFEAIPTALLQIYGGGPAQPMLIEQLACGQLQIQEKR